MSLKNIIPSVLLLVSLHGYGQAVEFEFMKTESILKEYFTSLYNSQDDKTIDSLNILINTVFSDALKSPASFNYSWSSLDMIGKLHSGDQKLNIYTWYIKYARGGYRYFGFIQYNQGSKKKPDIKFYTLRDKSAGMKNPETLKLTASDWLGCVYFKIVEYSSRGDKYYTLFGYDFNNDFSDKKIIEVLTFQKDKEPVFEGDFQLDLQKVKRVIFEYSSQLVASIRYDEKLRMIVFDHLSPFEQMFTGNYRFYGPDGSFDAFRFQKGSFILQKDVDARNE